MKKSFSDVDQGNLTPLGNDAKSELSYRNPFGLEQNSTSGFPTPSRKNEILKHD